MKKLHKSLILSLAIIAWVHLELATAQPAKISVSTPDWPPFYIDESLRSEKNIGKGFAWDVLELCTKKLDLEPQFEQYPIRRMFKEMERGKLELNIMSFKKDRTKAVSYGKEVVFTNTYALWTRLGISKSPTILSDLDPLKIADLVGLRTSDEYRTYLDTRLKLPQGGGVTVAQTTEAIAKMLAAKRVDATVLSSAEMRYRLQILGLQGQVREGNYAVTTQDYFLVIANASPILKTQPNLLKRMDRCVSRLRKDGTLQKLQLQYGI